MRMKLESLSVADLLDLKNNGMLRPNPEYQRGIVWTSSQRKKLIDSVMRNYPLPLIYLHHIKKMVAGMILEDLQIIDGQQRIDALYQFKDGSFKLFHPVYDEEAHFPIFLKDPDCPWGGKDFHGLSDELKEQFLKTPISVAKITCDNDNEARDLFVRLQAGLPLNYQETRDAWPGQFTDFMLRIGGKPQLERYPGHPFFQRAMGMNPATDRGKTRQLAAQIAMLFFGRREKGPDVFSDINSPSINNFYYTHIDFDASLDDAKRLVAIFDKLDSLLGTGYHPKIRAHDAIHLVLLVDTLWDEYTRSWESALPRAFDKFSYLLAKAKDSKDSADPNEFWLRYGQWTRVNSDRGDRIRHRHQFYMEKMFQFLQPLELKDPKRLFDPLERELVYLRDDKKCAVCKAPVLWAEAEVHHVKPHNEGGKTTMYNGRLVHKHCHPKVAGAELEVLPITLTPINTPSDKAEPHKILPHGVRTPESAYYAPILDLLVETGGSAQVADILEKLPGKMQGILKDIDFEPMKSSRDEPRWRNATRFTRNTMVLKGLLKRDSPRGVWEITDQGRGWLTTSRG